MLCFHDFNKMDVARWVARERLDLVSVSSGGVEMCCVFTTSTRLTWPGGLCGCKFNLVSVSSGGVERCCVFTTLTRWTWPGGLCGCKFNLVSVSNGGVERCCVLLR